MAWDQDKPATEISYSPYSPSPSELEATRGKNARIEAWTRALPEPHPGSGHSVGAHSAQWSDRAPSNISNPSNLSGPSPSRDLSTVRERQREQPYQHPFANAAPGVRPPRPPQLEIHRRPPRGAPVAPLLAQTPHAQDYAADYELPRADHLVNPVHAPPAAMAAGLGGPNSMRFRREAYFAAALDLPLDMITESLPGDLERQLHMYQSQWEERQRPEKPPTQQLYPADERHVPERRGTFRSLLGRSKSQASLKPLAGPPSAGSSDRSARGVSLDPATAASTAGTLAKMRSMDAKLLQRASMHGSMNPVTGNEAGGMQEASARRNPQHSQAPGPAPNNMPGNGTLARSASHIRAGPSAPPPPTAFRNGHTNAPREDGEPVVRLTRRTSSRGALAQSAKAAVNAQSTSRTPSPQSPDDASPPATPAPAPQEEQGAPASGVLISHNAPRANGNSTAAVETRTPDRKKEDAPVNEAHSREARAPSKIPTASAPVKPSATSQTRGASKAPPALPTVVVTTPPDEGSKRLDASVTKAKDPSKANTSNPGLPKRTSSISRAAKQSSPAAPAPAPSHPPPQPPGPPSRASAQNPGPSPRKSVPAATKENRRFSVPSGEDATSSKPQTKRRVFSWLGARKAAEDKENQRASKAKAQPSQTARPGDHSRQRPRQNELGQSQPAVVAAPPPAQSAHRTQPTQSVLHGQSKQPSNLSHHQPPPSMGNAGNRPVYDPETHTHHAETPLQHAFAPDPEQRFYTPPPPQPDGSHHYDQQHVGVAPSGYDGQWQQQKLQSPMAPGNLGAGGIPRRPVPVPGQQALYGVQAGYPPQPDPYAYAGQPLPEIPPQPMRPPTAPQAYSVAPQAPGAVPPPSEAMPGARRPWLPTVPPLFTGPSNTAAPGDPGARGDGRQKRMSMSEDNTNLKKQVSSTSKTAHFADEHLISTTSAVVTSHRTGPTNAALTSSMSGNTSRLASSEDALSTHPSLRTLSTLVTDTPAERLDTDTLSRTLIGSPSGAGAAPSPISPLDPQGISPPTMARTPASTQTPPAPARTADPVTPPRPSAAAGPITLGQGFTPLKVSCGLFGSDGSGTESDGTPTKKKSSGNGTSGDGSGAPNDARSGSGGANSHAPSVGTGGSACGLGAPSRQSGWGSSGSSTDSSVSSESETNPALTPSKFDLRGKSWCETERSVGSHGSAPSVSEPLAPIKLPELPLMPPPLPQRPEPQMAEPEAEMEMDVPEIGPDWLELEPDYLGLMEGQVFLHHCGSLRVLEVVDEEDEPEPEPEPKPEPKPQATAVAEGTPTGAGQAKTRGRGARRGAVSAPHSPLSGTTGTPRALRMEMPGLDQLPDMDEYLARGAPPPPTTETGAIGPAPPSAPNGEAAPGFGSPSGTVSGVTTRTGAARSTRSALPRAVRTVVIGPEASGTDEHGSSGTPTARSTRTSS